MKNSTRLARIKNQELGEIRGDTGSYERWVDMHGRRNEEGEPEESVQANPDSLPEGTSYFGDTQPTRAQVLMGEAIEHLQGRQKQVYLLMMREDYSCAQAGKKLGISKWTARDYKDRAIRFIQQYCKRAVEKWD